MNFSTGKAVPHSCSGLQNTQTATILRTLATRLLNILLCVALMTSLSGCGRNESEKLDRGGIDVDKSNFIDSDGGYTDRNCHYDTFSGGATKGGYMDDKAAILEILRKLETEYEEVPCNSNNAQIVVFFDDNGIPIHSGRKIDGNRWRHVAGIGTPSDPSHCLTTKPGVVAPDYPEFKEAYGTDYKCYRKK